MTWHSLYSSYAIIKERGEDYFDEGLGGGKIHECFEGVIVDIDGDVMMVS